MEIANKEANKTSTHSARVGTQREQALTRGPHGVHDGRGVVFALPRLQFMVAPQINQRGP